MTYNVLNGTLNPSQFNSFCILCFFYDYVAKQYT